MLEFYEFNTLNIIVVLVSTFIIYYIMSNYLVNKSKDKKNKSSQFSLEYLIISVIIAVCISLIVAYVMSSGDESVLTDNFWDPIKEQQTVE
jgi:multisubunit Na+/H+ antiporter MnhB subunit